MPDFLFEAKLVGAYRLHAVDEITARQAVASGRIVLESLTLDDAAGPELIEIDGEAV